MILFWVVHFKYLLKRIFSSVAQSCLTLCDPMDCSMQGLPVHHQLPEPTQTHVHWVGDAIQPSHPLSSPSPPAFNLAQNQVFSNGSVLIRWPKYWSFSFSISPSNEYSGLISFIHMVFLFCIFKQLCYICFVLNSVAKKQFKRVGAVSWLLRMTFFLISLILLHSWNAVLLKKELFV